MKETETKANCHICSALGDHYFADFDDNMELPNAVKQLIMVLNIDFSHDLRICPICGTCYEFNFETDNDIFQPTHTGEYYRIPAERANQIIEQYNQFAKDQKKHHEDERKRYKRKARNKYKQLYLTLSVIEQQIFDFIAERRYEDTSLTLLQEELSLDAEIIKTALEHLFQLGILWKYSYKEGRYKIDF